MSYPDTTTSFGFFKQSPMGQTLALNDINLELHEGENLALIGSNGSGKSTLLRVLAGIYPPNSGTIISNGKVQTLFNMGIGMKPELTGRQNATLMGMIAGKSREEILSMLPEIISFSELQNVFDQPVRTYSRGMAMRLSFAVATSLKPDILLIDEWIGAGDERFRGKAQERLTSMVGKVAMEGPVDDVLDAYIETTRRNRKIRKADAENTT